MNSTRVSVTRRKRDNAMATAANNCAMQFASHRLLVEKGRRRRGEDRCDVTGRNYAKEKEKERNDLFPDVRTHLSDVPRCLSAHPRHLNVPLLSVISSHEIYALSLLVSLVGDQV